MSLNVVDSPEHSNVVTPLSALVGADATRAMTLRKLTRALEAASKDERIKALFLEGSFQPGDYGSGFACLRELRGAILNFRRSGKPVYAYLASPTTRDYYVASAATEIYLNPYGEMDMPGLASVKTYYAGFLQKYGIDVQVTRVGKYKSFVEPFILTKMSDADREETQKILGDVWGDFVKTVSDARQINPATLQNLVNTEGYILPGSAREAKLVDHLGYFGDVLAELGRIAPDNNSLATVPLAFKQISISDYASNAGRIPHLVGDRGSNVVAVLYLEGEIVDGQGDTGNIGGDRFATQLRQLSRDDDVKAVVLRVNSPGGSAFASEVIQREVIALKAKKPVIVSMGNYAASGGYWVSTFGDRIFAEPNTLTGSIGVFGLFFDVQKLGNTYGFTWDTAKTNNYADFETISRPKTPAEIALAQARVDDLYGKFLDKVATGRHIPIQTLETIAQGRVWSGEQALQLGLVDEIGGLQKAINYAADRTKLGDRYKVKEYPEQIGFADALAALFTHQETPISHAMIDPLTREFLKVKNDLRELQGFNDPAGMYARLPLGWEIK
jgi:protease-4